MSLTQNLQEMELTRERYWLRYPATSPTKLRWRALMVRHCFHVLPGESVLELGAGSGLWTEHLEAAFRGENPITAAVFNGDLAARAEARQLASVSVAQITDLLNDLPAESFDYVVGTAILCHERYEENLDCIRRLLKPGGQLLFFEANFWNPQVLVKNALPPVGRWTGQAESQIGMRRYRLLHATSRQGFVEVEIVPYDIVHPRTPRRLVSALQSTAYVVEHVPLLRDLCGTLYIWAKKPTPAPVARPVIDLATHPELHGSVSVVIPCRDEEMNVGPLVRALLATYDAYLHEVIVVDDCSTDRTAAVVEVLAADDDRVRLVRRTPPGGVGRALRDGYAAVTGEYVLSMDCDFGMLVPELRDLFDAVADGADGAVGSRFSHESIVLNYPLGKILGNRGFHLLARLLLGLRMRDVSNNLKLYRTSVIRELEIESPDFAANAELGLKPVLAGYDIREVPISWINRTIGMGASSFKALRVAPSYWRALARLVWRSRLGWRSRRTMRAAREQRLERARETVAG
jgi:dolichol-phosphate mannosyltransferase